MAYAEFASSGYGEQVTTLVQEVSDSGKGYAVGSMRLLMQALLFDAVQAYLMYANLGGRPGRAKYQEAVSWVEERGNDYVFSFDSVCEGLGIDPEYLRYGLANALNSPEMKRCRRTF